MYLKTQDSGFATHIKLGTVMWYSTGYNLWCWVIGHVNLDAGIGVVALVTA